MSKVLYQVKGNNELRIIYRANNMLLPPDTKNKRKSLSPHGFEK